MKGEERNIILINFLSCVVCLVSSFNYKRLIIQLVSRGGKREGKKTYSGEKEETMAKHMSRQHILSSTRKA